MNKISKENYLKIIRKPHILIDIRSDSQKIQGFVSHSNVFNSNIDEIADLIESLKESALPIFILDNDGSYDFELTCNSNVKCIERGSLTLFD